MSKTYLATITFLTEDPGAHPEHPIYYPPGMNSPRPPGIWGGGNEGFPTPPMAPGGPPPHPAHPIPPNIWPDPLPPNGGGEPPDGEKPPSGELPQVLDWHTVWTEEYGWALIGVQQTGVAPSAVGGTLSGGRRK